MNRARLWPKILDQALKAEARSIHLEPQSIRFYKNGQFEDIVELSLEEFEALLKWLEILGNNWRIKDAELKTEIYSDKAVVKIFKKHNRYLNNLKGLYFFENKKALEEILDYLAKKDLHTVSLEDHIELNPKRGLTAERAIGFLKSDVIIVPHLEEGVLEAIVKKALTGKLVLVNKMIKDEEEGINYLLQQGMKPHVVKSIWQGIIK